MPVTFAHAALGQAALLDQQPAHPQRLSVTSAVRRA